MTIQTRVHDYRHGDVALRATIAWDDAAAGPRPGVLVSHAWRGRTMFEDGKAHALAALGYTGFALDLYGAGVTGSNPEENRRLMQPFLDDRARLSERMAVAHAELRGLAEVDEKRTAAIGFCFGGLCVLDLARSGAAVDGVVSFHGLLQPPPGAESPVGARVLVLHGWDDPMATPPDVLAFAGEMTRRQADWQLHAYGGTLHAFTNPQAADPDNGLLYDAAAERRSWQAMTNFLAELFGEH